MTHTEYVLGVTTVQRSWPAGPWRDRATVVTLAQRQLRVLRTTTTATSTVLKRGFQRVILRFFKTALQSNHEKREAAAVNTVVRPIIRTLTKLSAETTSSHKQQKRLQHLADVFRWELTGDANTVLALPWLRSQNPLQDTPVWTGHVAERTLEETPIKQHTFITSATPPASMAK